MSNGRMGGVELLALYGEDDRLGAFLPGLKKGLRKAVSYTPAGYALDKSANFRKKHHLLGADNGRMSGYNDDTRMGAFLPGLKKVGKFTSKITGGLAKAVLPPALVDAAAKLDPMKKGASVKKAVVAVQPKAIVPVKKEAFKVDTKKAVIIGVSGLGALVVLKVLLSSPRRA